MTGSTELTTTKENCKETILKHKISKKLEKIKDIKTLEEILNNLDHREKTEEMVKKHKGNLLKILTDFVKNSLIYNEEKKIYRTLIRTLVQQRKEHKKDFNTHNIQYYDPYKEPIKTILANDKIVHKIGIKERLHHLAAEEYTPGIFPDKTYELMWDEKKSMIKLRYRYL